MASRRQRFGFRERLMDLAPASLYPFRVIVEYANGVTHETPSLDAVSVTRRDDGTVLLTLSGRFPGSDREEVLVTSGLQAIRIDVQS